MSVLQELLATRDAAKVDFDYVAEVYRASAEAGDVPEGYEDAYTEHRSKVDAIDERIREVSAQVRTDREIAEARRLAGLDVTPKVHVTEARTYGVGSPNSYVLDRVRAAVMGCPGQSEAIGRLNQHAAEVAGEIRDPNSAEGKRALRSLKNNWQENENKRHVDEAIDRARVYTSEARAGLDTTSASGGSFVTPQYFVSDYAPFRQFGRTFIDACNKQPLPDYGMTIYIPQVTAAASVSAQALQNEGIAETDPTAGYLSQALTTNAGQVTVSQQLLDRAGPNFQYDTMVFDQLSKAYNLTVDVYALTQALANAGSVSYSSPALTGAASLYSLIGKAVSNIATTAGTVMAPTHAFIHPTNWAWHESQVDSQNRLLVTQNFAGPVNAAGVGGDGTIVAEGDTGYKVHGLPLLTDANIPLKSSNNQAVVANMAEVYVWEGDPVDRVVPQTYAENLSVLFQRYAYIAAIVRYPTAVQSLNGAGLPTAPSF